LEDDDPKNRKKFETLVQRIETTLVNGTRATVSNYKQFLKNNNVNEGIRILKKEEVIQASITKQIRLDYFQRIVDFYENLKYMCEKLHTFPREPKEIRNNLLRNYMMSFNMQIKVQREEMRNENSSLSKKRYCHFMNQYNKELL
jgi:archaellum biogenesis ATPase FlaH